jgi:hypothetical protein
MDTARARASSGDLILWPVFQASMRATPRDSVSGTSHILETILDALGFPDLLLRPLHRAMLHESPRTLTGKRAGTKVEGKTLFSEGEMLR